ncbi:MAG: NAD(P)-dependent oxidoreductase [Planctomycetota bacterium]|nr:NAD(P)-dependent oxidoreductase [Planctomycetota bacterium]
MADTTQLKPTILITGGSGLLGAAIARRLRGDHRIVILDIKPPPEDIKDDVKFREMDLTSKEDVQKVVRGLCDEGGGAFDSVIHLAAYYDFSGDPSDLYEQITVRGTERLLKALRDCECEVGQFIFSSTMLVHRATEPGKPITEDTPLEAHWDYPQSKIDTERIIYQMRDAIPAVILRIAGVYTDDCESIPIAHQIQRIVERRLTANVFPGDVSHGQAFVHLEDLVDAIERTVARRKTLPKTTEILIAEPETPSYDEIQKEVARLVHGEKDWSTHEIPKAIAKSGAWVQGKIPGVEHPFIKPWMIDLADDHYEIDISRAEELLDWRPDHRLIDSIESMIECLREDPRGFYERHDLSPPDDLEEKVAGENAAAGNRGR